MTKRAFRAESGLDAGGHNVQNVAYPRDGLKSDGVNVQYFIDKNTIQPFDKTRAYDKFFAVSHLKRIWIAQVDIAAGRDFDHSQWESLRVDPTWAPVNGTPAGGRQLESGDYLTAYSVNSELEFILPDAPNTSDTIVIKDEGKYTHLNKILVTSKTRPIGLAGSATEQFTIPGSMKTFIYSNLSGGRWIVHTSIDNIAAKTISKSDKPNQVASGDLVYRKSSTGHIVMQLPKYAVDGDVVSTYDVDGLTAVNGATMQVHPDSGHTMISQGQTSITTNGSGSGHFVFNELSKTWSLWDGDIRSRWKTIQSNTNAMPFDHIAVIGGSGTVAVTLPQAAGDGDIVRVSNQYATTGLTVQVKVFTNSGHKIVGAEKEFIYPKYKDISKRLADVVRVDSMTFTPNNYGVTIEFHYHQASKSWLVSSVDTRVEHVDETNRDRPGVAPLASQAEVDKNHEQNPRDDMIVTPKTLANSVATESRRGIARIATAAELQLVTTGAHLNDVIVTPKRLNERQATETIRGLAEVATQTEANDNANDTHIITPKKFNGRRATQAMAGTVRIISSTATPATSRTVAGVGVYDWSDAINNEPFVITPKTLNKAQATETSRGVAYIATQGEANTQGSTASDLVIITPKKLDARRSTDAMAGIAEIATQAEANAGTDYTRIITPKTLNDRRATETLHGLAEIATQAEVDAGALDTHIVSPLKLKTWLGYEHFVSTRASGIKHTGNLWGKVTLDIDVATETQRGTLEVATQAEANDMTGSDIHIITPKKLSARKATETLTGIAEIATQAEVDAETIHTHIVTPNSLGKYIHVATSAQMTEAANGTAHTASLAETWVGNDTAGSTQTYDKYAHNPFAVTPRGLNFALQNYLPKKGKAFDADKLDGLDSTQFLRSDQSGTLKGNLTVTGSVTGILKHKSGYFTIAPFSSSYGEKFKCEIYYKEKDQGGTVEKHGLVINAIDRVSNPNVSKDLNIWLNGKQVYHQGFRPTPAEIGAYTKAEADSKFVDAAGDTMSGNLKIRRAGTHLDLIDSGTADKTWRLEVSGGELKITESNVRTQMVMLPGGATTFGSSVRANGGFNVAGTLVIETDAKINWNKLKGIASATTSTAGIVKLNNTLDSSSQTEAATANTIRILKEMIDSKAGIEGAIMNDLKIKNWIRIGNVILRPNAANKTLDFIWTDEPM